MLRCWAVAVLCVGVCGLFFCVDQWNRALLVGRVGLYVFPCMCFGQKLHHLRHTTCTRSTWSRKVTRYGSYPTGDEKYSRLKKIRLYKQEKELLLETCGDRKPISQGDCIGLAQGATFISADGSCTFFNRTCGAYCRSLSLLGKGVRFHLYSSINRCP